MKSRFRRRGAINRLMFDHDMLPPGRTRG